MKKNCKVDLFGTVWTIKYIGEVIKTEGGDLCFGQCDMMNHVIEVSTVNAEGKLLPVNEVELTLLHELFHAILMTGQYVGYSNDEPLVEWIARCVYKMLKSNII